MIDEERETFTNLEMAIALNFSARSAPREEI